MKKFKNVFWISILIVLLILIVCIVGYNFLGKKEEKTNVKLDNGITVMLTVDDIKNEFKAQEAETNYTFKPFYNVEQTTEFTFHFNSVVDPIKAVTVHTDSKCEETSTVYQLNDGYRTEDGVDVVVKPMDPVLNTEGRNNSGKKSGIWGYAPIYYLCVRYDLDSTTVKKLDNPIIIPFTVKNKISTPNAYMSISDEGIASIKWLPVEGATSYKIYRCLPPSTKAINYTREECAYMGDILDLVDTVDSSKNEYIAKYDKSSTLGGTIIDNSQVDSMGYVVSQNYVFGYTYYVTAVDANGNESFFSKAICDTQYASILPHSVKIKSLYSNEEDYYMEKFPNTVDVLQCDNKTLVSYPINFYRLDTPTSSITKKCEYKYEVVGTKLTGTAQYYNESGEFPEEALSDLKPNNGAMPETPVEIIPSVDVDSMSADYKNANIDLASKTTYPEEAKIKLDSASLLRRADMEAARLFSGGTYRSSLDTIESYVASDNPEYIAIKHPNGVIEVVKNDGVITKPDDDKNVTKPDDDKNVTEPDDDKNVTEPDDDKNVTKPDDDKNVTEPDDDKNVTKPDDDKNVTEPDDDDDNITTEKDYEPDTVINNNNYVDEQRKTTEKEVEEGNKEKVKGTNYPVFAETAGQKYLALNLINHEDSISLKAFPEYANPEEFFDDLAYVWYQNPYIMTLDALNSKFSDDFSTFYPKYGVDKETTEKYQKAVYEKSNQVVSSIITKNMTDEEKVVKIYEYLEDNAEYNHEAADYMGKGNDLYERYPNSWNTYGILCEGLGVCQSYAYAFNILAYESGLESVMATGTMRNGGHAWNAVKLDGKWYMVDATNNGNTLGIPYWVCSSSTDFIYKNGFVLDESFVDGTNYSEFLKNDDEYDWYATQGLYATSINDCVDIWMEQKDKSDKIFIKYSVDNLDTFMKAFIKLVLSKGVTLNELSTWYVQAGGGMVLFQNGQS